MNFSFTGKLTSNLVIFVNRWVTSVVLLTLILKLGKESLILGTSLRINNSISP